MRRQQLLQPLRIRPRNVDDFRPAPCSRHQRYVMTGDAECVSHRSERGRGSLAVDGALGDPHDEGPAALSAHARAG